MSYQTILKKVEIEHHARLIAVSKTKPIDMIMPMYELGQRLFGENRVHEVVEKYDAMPKDIAWHLIGSLQKNKVKYIAPFISMIHSIDSIELAKEVNKQALKNDRVIDVLLQIKIADEDSKQGYEWSELELDCKNGLLNFTHIRICGVMGMATFTDEQAQVRSEFKLLKSYFDHLKSKHFKDQSSFSEISMGMSGDYEIALEEGATLVRIGSALFGSR